MIAEKIETFLKEQDWTYDYDQFHGVFSVEADLECKLASALIVYQATEEGFLCYTTIAQQAVSSIRPMMGEYLHRANYGLPNGNFEFDYDSGEIHYKTYFDCPEGAVTQKQLEDSVTIGLSVFDRYGDGLYEILQNDNIAKKLIEELEAQEG